MENELEIKRVPFMGAELMAARDTDGQIWARNSWRPVIPTARFGQVCVGCVMEWD